MKEFEEKVKASEAEKSLEDADMGKVAGGHAGFNPGCGYEPLEEKDKDKNEDRSGGATGGW